MKKHDVTLDDIKSEASALGITYTSGDTWFDLDTDSSALLGLHGTYQRSDLGIEAAYGDLVRHRESEARQS